MDFARFEFLSATVRGEIPGTSMADRIAAADELVADHPPRAKTMERILRQEGRYAAGNTRLDNRNRA